MRLRVCVRALVGDMTLHLLNTVTATLSAEAVIKSICRAKIHAHAKTTEQPFNLGENEHVRSPGSCVHPFITCFRSRETGLEYN